jgi:hypothetical protein
MWRWSVRHLGPECVPEDLSGGRLGDLFDGLDRADPFVRGDALCDVQDERVGVEFVACGDDVGLGYLSARSSGTPITAQSATAGWAPRIISSSAGKTWKPLCLMISLIRPTISNQPSLFMTAMSPVRSQPSGSIISAVACGLFR